MRACSGSRSMRCRPTLACTLICESAWPITSCSSRAMRTRSRCSAVWRRRIASARNSAARSRRTRTNAPMPKHAASSARRERDAERMPVERRPRRRARSPRPTRRPPRRRPTASRRARRRARSRTRARRRAARRRARAAGRRGRRRRRPRPSGPGYRREPSSASGPIAASATWPSPAAHPTWSQTAMPIAAGTCTSRLMITGARSTNAGRRAEALGSSVPPSVPVGPSVPLGDGHPPIVAPRRARRIGPAEAHRLLLREYRRAGSEERHRLHDVGVDEQRAHRAEHDDHAEGERHELREVDGAGVGPAEQLREAAADAPPTGRRRCGRRRAAAAG